MYKKFHVLKKISIIILLWSIFYEHRKNTNLMQCALLKTELILRKFIISALKRSHTYEHLETILIRQYALYEMTFSSFPQNFLNT